jgi:hypothetical protein
MHQDDRIPLTFLDISELRAVYGEASHAGKLVSHVRIIANFLPGVSLHLCMAASSRISVILRRIGRTKGGLNSKLHAVRDGVGRLQLIARLCISNATRPKHGREAQGLAAYINALRPMCAHLLQRNLYRGNRHIFWINQ